MRKDILSGMTSVMIFSPDESQEETDRKWGRWLKDNHQSAVADKYVPCAAETRKMLSAK